MANPGVFPVTGRPAHSSAGLGHPVRSWAPRWLGLGLLCLMAVSACSEQPLPAGGPLTGTPPPSAEAPRQHAEFAVLIDNSKSIKPSEQVIIREATMLLADLADPGDRIAVITFGDGARTVVSKQLRSDPDRDAFKTAVRNGVDFRENFSDIRAGIRHLAQEKAQLLPSPDAIRAAVLFTDGKLEPKDRQTRNAFDQIQADLHGPLAGLPVYAVVLGDTSSREPIPGLTELTGLALMSNHLASRPEHFYHARSLEELPDIAVTILNDTKGISSLGEQSGADFRVDSTVGLMNLIVRKRAPGPAGDAELPTSAQIALVPPPDSAGAVNQPPPASEGQAVYRNTNYQNFDLFVVRHPHPGIWRVTRTDGKEAHVLSKIVSAVTLGKQVPEQLYVNEAAPLTAWIYDEAKKTRVDGGYQLQARVAEAGSLQSSERFITLKRDEESGRYSAVLPQDLFSALGRAPGPGRFEIQIIARNDGDPWFLRRSAPLPLKLLEPLVVWRELPRLVQRVPLTTHEVILGGSVDKAAYQSLGFQAPAALQVTVEKFDPKTGQYSRVLEQEVRGVDADGRLDYLLSGNFTDYADYRYAYAFSGPLQSGPFRIQSQPGYFRVGFDWRLATIAALTALVLLELLSVFTAKLRGRIQVEKTGLNPADTTQIVAPRREWRSASVPDIDFGRGSFEVKPRRHLFLYKRLCVTVNGTDATLNNTPLANGRTACLKVGGRHTLSFTHADGDAVVATLNLMV